MALESLSHASPNQSVRPPNPTALIVWIDLLHVDLEVKLDSSMSLKLTLGGLLEHFKRDQNKGESKLSRSQASAAKPGNSGQTVLGRPQVPLYYTRLSWHALRSNVSFQCT